MKESVFRNIKKLMLLIIKKPDRFFSFLLVTDFFLYVLLLLTAEDSAELGEGIISLTVVWILKSVIALLLTYLCGGKMIASRLGGKPICRADHKARIMPILEKCAAEAKRDGLDIPDNIKVYVSDEEYPFVIATGRDTICISTGMIEDNGESEEEQSADDELIETMLYGELYKISERTPEFFSIAALSSIIALSLILTCVVALKIAKEFSDSNRERGAFFIMIIGYLMAGVALLLTRAYGLSLLAKHTDSKADKYVVQKGHGIVLCAILDCSKNEPKPGLIYAESKLHASEDKRISKIQSLGVQYSGV